MSCSCFILSKRLVDILKCPWLGRHSIPSSVSGEGVGGRGKIIQAMFALIFFLFVLLQAQVASAQQGGLYFTIDTQSFPNGVSIDRMTINSPPVPPLGFEIGRRAVMDIKPDMAAGVNMLTVPAFNWVFGCSAVSGAMIAGYYDRNGWPNMYTGSTNGGVMPLNNGSWPNWMDSSGSTYPNCPLIASHNGIDGRTGRGSIDDYWVQYNSAANDPYITNGWPQHAWSDAIGDYMKTSQSAYGNADGATSFWGYPYSASPLTCADMDGYGISADGTQGRKQFYEARGYVVTDCYNQNTDNRVSGGFSFAQYRAEIDAGRPVMLNLEGHTVVGVGYDAASNLVYIHDTWDYNNHTMAWGGSYAGMALISVSIVNLAGGGDATNPTVNITSPTSSGAYTALGGSVTIAGTAADNVGVTQVTWANDRGGSGTASGTVSWSQSGISLYPGANVLTVTARDAAGNIGMDTLRVVYFCQACLPSMGGWRSILGQP
jgi:YD repeat-containing protein